MMLKGNLSFIILFLNICFTLLLGNSPLNNHHNKLSYPTNLIDSKTTPSNQSPSNNNSNDRPNNSPGLTHHFQGTVYPNQPVPYGTGYYYDPGVTFNVKANRKVESFNKNDQKLKFQLVVKEMKDLKIDLFGNADYNMEAYKKNKDGIYDSNWLKRARKIAKILELEELLDYYENNNKNIRYQNELINKNLK